MGSPSHVLLVGVDRRSRDAVRACLDGDHHAVREADSTERVLAEVERARPGLIVVVLQGFRAEGIELCMRLRGSDIARTIPILMVGHRDGELDRVLALELGVDAFLIQPFTARELMAHVHALLRRAPATAPVAHEVFERGRLRVDFDACEVLIDGRPTNVTLRDFELLTFFVRHPNRVYRRHELLELVWGKDADVEPRTVDAHILRLRRQLERTRSRSRLFITVRGVGYRFNPESLDERSPPARASGTRD